MATAPAWIESLVDDVACTMEVHNHMGPLGYRWLEDDDFCELVIYPTPVEVVGGAEDGAVLVPGFSLHLKGVQELFDELSDFQWYAQSMGPYDPYSPRIALEGVYRGRHVFLQILGEAPDDENPGLKMNTQE